MRSANFPRSSAKYSKLKSWRVAASASFGENGANVNAFLLQKRYAALLLHQRLQGIHDEVARKEEHNLKKR